MTEDLLQVRTLFANFHVLRDRKGLYLIDAGMAGAVRCLARGLAAKGWAGDKIVGIIVTHGHLDHILNIGRLAREHGAWIAAPRLDEDHYAGRPSYTGWARVCGWLEATGRPLLGFEPFVPDRWIDDGEFLDVWHGLRAVALPGHTAGHTGFFCEKLGLLFSADLFASYGWGPHFPPPIFNSLPGLMQASVEKALALGAAGVLPNHGGRASPEEHLTRLAKLAGR